MSGTIAGGRKAAITNKASHGDDFYRRIAAIGGRKGTTGGFAANRELASIAGAKGGRKSRRGKATNTCEDPNSTSSKSTTSTSNQVCADCGRDRVAGAPGGTCQCPAWRPF